jgi:hypothetical protein
MVSELASTVGRFATSGTSQIGVGADRIMVLPCRRSPLRLCRRMMSDMPHIFNLVIEPNLVIEDAAELFGALPGWARGFHAGSIGRVCCPGMRTPALLPSAGHKYCAIESLWPFVVAGSMATQVPGWSAAY